MVNNYKIRPTLQINKRVIDPKDRGQIYEKMVGFLQWLSSKKSTYNAGDTGDAGSIPGLRRSPGRGNGSPLQYSCLKSPMEEEPGGLQSKESQRVGHN